MASFEIIETSDTEEQELIDAETSPYWKRATVEIFNHYDLLQRTYREGEASRQSLLPEEYVSMPLLCRSTPPAHREHCDNPSPRKRIKLDHDTLLQGAQGAYTSSSRSATLCDASSRSGSPGVETDDPLPGGEDSQWIAAPPPSTLVLSQETLPGIDEGDYDFPSLSKAGRWSSPKSPFRSLRYDSIDLGTTSIFNESPIPMVSSSVVDIDHESPDPLYLSTPPRILSVNAVDPPAELPTTPGFPRERRFDSRSPLFTPRSQITHPSSPITPLSSKVNRVRAPSHPPEIPQGGSPATVITEEVPLPDCGAIENENYPRYSLRTRQARQLNPYAYDQAYYKKLMQGNPDAIVKVVSPEHEKRRHHHHHHHDHDLPFDDTRRSRSRSRNDSPIRKAPRPRRSLERERARSSKELSSVRLPDSPAAWPGPKWYPKILENGLSSDEDEPEFLERLSLSPAKRVDPNQVSEEVDDDTRPDSATTPFFMQKQSVGLWTKSSSLPPYAVSPKPHQYDVKQDLTIDSYASFSSPPASAGPLPEPERSDFELSESASSDELSKQDRRRLKILRRMMPAAMINRALTKGQRRVPRSAHSSDDEADEADVLPGQSRRRITHGIVRAEVIGDSESSEPESVLKSSDDESEQPSIRLSRSPLPQAGRASSPLAQHSDAERGLGEDELDEEEIDSWLNDTSKARAVPGRRSNRRQDDLIDWMLTKTRHFDNGQAHRKRQRSHWGEPGQSAGSQLNVVTAGAKRYGDSRQTLLNFSKADQDSNRTSRKHASAPAEPIEGEERDFDQGGETQVQAVDNYASKVARKKRRSTKPKAYVLSNSGGRVTSGRRQTHFITVDLEDEDFRQALAPHRGSEERQRGPSKSRAGILRDLPGSAIDICSDDEEPYVPLDIPGRIPEPPEQISRDIKSDCNVPFLPSGVTFGPNTYIGRGWLYELTTTFSSDRIASRPMAYGAYDIDLDPTLTSTSFSEIFPSVCDLCFNRATASPANDADLEEDRKWEVLAHVACQLMTWLSWNRESVEEMIAPLSAVETEVARLVHRLEELAIGNDALEKPGFWAAYWFCVESSVRLSVSSRQSEPSDLKPFIKYGSRLVGHLARYGLQKTVDSVTSLDKPLDDTEVSIRTAELWISLFHVCEATATFESQPLSRMVLEAMQETKTTVYSYLETSEITWKMIFVISALSQFSVHGMATSTPRLLAAWELVEFALKRIRLTAEFDSTPGLSNRSLSKRDGYVRLVISRCFVLWKTWHWRLDSAIPIFNHLVEVFKSRKFTNLRDEPSEFPNFLRRRNLQRLSECKNGDTAFTIFLKLIVQTVSDLRKYGPQGHNDPSASKLKKLLSLAVPVGSVPFTKAAPPTKHELSMLCNRYSAIAVAIYLDPSLANIRYRVSQAQRYVIFRDADFETRMVCIRGAMYLVMLIRHLHAAMDVVNVWLAEITNILVDECTGMATGKHLGDSRKWSLVAIQALLGSVRLVIKTPTMDPSTKEVMYPEPGLIGGPWVTRVFAASTNLANIPTTGLEIRRLVQAFLDARALVMPKPRIVRPAPVNPTVTNEDSQDDYGDLDLDMDDPELLAALGEDVESATLKEMKAKDEVVCQVMDQHISPAIYRLVCKNINESVLGHPTEGYWDDIDQWIDCWVECANVIVRNNRREWSHYLALGPQSWEKIIQVSWRRRVGLRFMYMVLQCDPSAYSAYQDRFLEVFFESLVTANVTFEHRYVALVLTIDGQRHHLLRDTPWNEYNKADLPVSDFISGRVAFLKAVFKNLSRRVREARDNQSRDQNQSYMELIVVMFSAMKSVFDEMEHHETYADLCRSVLGLLMEQAALKGHPRLLPFVQWANRADLIN